MANFYKQLFGGRKIKRLQQQAGQLQKEAKYLASTKGLAIETAKGMPAATVKIGKEIGKKIRYFLGGGEYGKKQDIRTKKRMEWWKEEKKRRGF